MSNPLGAHPELLDALPGIWVRMPVPDVSWDDGRVVVALRLAQVVPAIELRGTGVSSARFCFVPGLCPFAVGRMPGKARLQANIAAITDMTWEVINQQLMATAYTSGVERSTLWLVDGTAM